MHDADSLKPQPDRAREQERVFGYVKNSFLHFPDGDEEARGSSSRRSRSHDVSSHSSSSSHGQNQIIFESGSVGSLAKSSKSSSDSFTATKGLWTSSSSNHKDTSSSSDPHKDNNHAGAKMDSEKDGEQDLEPELPSVGAKLHASGNCTPCRFGTTSKCKYGQSCRYCHASGHEFSKGHRPSKSVRAGQKTAIERIRNSDLDPELKMKAYMDMAQQDLTQNGRRSPFLLALLRQVVPNIDDLLQAEAAKDGVPASSSSSKLSL